MADEPEHPEDRDGDDAERRWRRRVVELEDRLAGRAEASSERTNRLSLGVLWAQLPTALILLGLVWQGRGIVDQVEENRLTIQEHRVEALQRMDETWRVRSEQLGALRVDVDAIKAREQLHDRSSLALTNRIERVEGRMGELVDAINRLTDEAGLSRRLGRTPPPDDPKGGEPW